MSVDTAFFRKDQEQIGECIIRLCKDSGAPASECADALITRGKGAWRHLDDYPNNESTLSESLQARKDELAERARGGDRFAAALVEERERTGTERGFEGEPV